jgi:hypothetical protein
VLEVELVNVYPIFRITLWGTSRPLMMA